ncbi:hypothetical protein HYDPIDRAFT_118539 [Hydnomerulius pinastri MD-312]|uniref:Uncharacterized protein n=1 Tax=Hydnomerulius pinastri MD-312 TaxID=994086 RepID=A0A0C9W0N3_9AGAM|nr:hypothetical protein HYDPIDRAFT_118539 [Hydnomerulius pinastri MD-312]
MSSTRPSTWNIAGSLLKTLLLPLTAIGYLAFCYTVHGRVVPVNTYGLYAVTQAHLSAIKSGITSISIIIISIALYPLYDVLSDLKSEEFFRVLSSQSHGVRLSTINHISSPSFGNVNTMKALWRRSCSNYYFVGVLATLLAWVVGILAPAALTIESVLVDGDIMAFAIGSIPLQSVWNTSIGGAPGFTASLNSDFAASIVWAEMELGVKYSFGTVNNSDPEYAAYLVPIPPDLARTTSSRWLTDVGGINPTCSWASTNITKPVIVAGNLSLSTGVYFATASLPDFDLDIQVVGADLPFSSTSFATIKDPTSDSVRNHTNQAFTTTGSTIFLLGQCTSGCNTYGSPNTTLNFAGLPTFTIQGPDQSWAMAILACVPNLTIETREVRSEGNGLLSVQPRPPGGHQLTRQGNLHPVQTPSLLSIATKSITQSSGALSNGSDMYFFLGSKVQADMLFGKGQIGSLPGLGSVFDTNVTINLAPIADITEAYTQVLQSASKPYLAGFMGTAYVPGRVSTRDIIFTSSTPHVAVSTVIFALLSALIVLAHFRPGKGSEFTLINIAAAVHGSELPAQFAQMKAEQLAEFEPGLMGDHKGAQQDIAEMLGERKIFLQRRIDGSGVLHIS